MSFKASVINGLKWFFSLFGKDYLIEYWQIEKHENKMLPPIMENYSGFIIPGMKIFDVGANIGNYSMAFIKLGANVVGLEPQVYCQKILEKRFNGIEKFKLIKAASGASKSIGEIRKSNSHTIASMNPNWIDTVSLSKRFIGEEWDRKETVQVTTLDKVILDNFLPDYLKIDVEGFELEVLKGLSCPIKFVSFEITLPEMFSAAKECILQLEKIGNFHYAIPISKLVDIRQWYTPAEMLEQLINLSKSEEKVSSDIVCKLISTKT